MLLAVAFYSTVSRLSFAQGGAKLSLLLEEMGVEDRDIEDRIQMSEKQERKNQKMHT